eukprot:scaffold35517_cov60-Phaeocystis_antarctica.AAC.3
MQGEITGGGCSDYRRRMQRTMRLRWWTAILPHLNSKVAAYTNTKYSARNRKAYIPLCESTSTEVGDPPTSHAWLRAGLSPTYGRKLTGLLSNCLSASSAGVLFRMSGPRCALLFSFLVLLICRRPEEQKPPQPPTPPKKLAVWRFHMPRGLLAERAGFRPRRLTAASSRRSQSQRRPQPQRCLQS